jgi:hypothetical protein
MRIMINNPGGDWLARKQAAAKREMAENQDGRGRFGKGLFGGETASTPVIHLPVSAMAGLKGMNEEDPRPGNGKWDALDASIRQNGWVESESHVMVVVNQFGQAWLAEGNNRVAVAPRHGIDTLPATVQWYCGGERTPGPWSPASVEAMVAQTLHEGRKKKRRRRRPHLIIGYPFGVYGGDAGGDGGGGLEESVNEWPPVLEDAEAIADYIIHYATTDLSGDDEIEDYFQDERAVLHRVLISSLGEGNPDGNLRNRAKENRYFKMSPETMPPIVVRDGEVLDGNHRLRAAQRRGDQYIMAYVVEDAIGVLNEATRPQPRIGYHVAASKHDLSITSDGLREDSRGNIYVWDTIEMAQWFRDFSDDEMTIWVVSIGDLYPIPDPEAEDMSEWSSEFEPGTSGGGWVIQGQRIGPERVHEY